MPVINLLKVARIKNLARHLGIRSIVERNGRVEITFENPNVVPEGLLQAKNLFPGKLAFMPGPPEAMRLTASRLSLSIMDTLVKLFLILAGFENMGNMSTSLPFLGQKNE